MKPSTFFAAALIAWGVLSHPGPQKPSPTPKPDRPNDALVAAVRSKAPGDRVTLTYLDSTGKPKTVQVTLGTAKQ